jgi:mitochondrial fission protein ELM1
VITNVKEKGHFGDRNQSMGIKYSLVKMLKKKSVKVESKEVDFHELIALKSEIKKLNNKSIVISSGDYGIEALQQLKNDRDIAANIMTIWSGHQEFDSLNKALPSLNVVVLPEYVITEDFRKEAKVNHSQLVGVDFIPHNLSLKNLRFAYEKFEYKNQIPLNKPYTIVLFGGDAPDSQGNILKISDREIINMASMLAKIVKANKSTFIIVNSYRTKEEQIKLFLNQLKADDVTSYVFFDFHNKVNSYKALLYLISQGNAAVVTGESISMIDEAIQFSKKPVYIQEVSSMNQNHHKHLNFTQKTQYTMLLSEYKESNLEYKHPEFSSKFIVSNIKEKILAFLESVKL